MTCGQITPLSEIYPEDHIVTSFKNPSDGSRAVLSGFCITDYWSAESKLFMSVHRGNMVSVKVLDRYAYSLAQDNLIYRWSIDTPALYSSVFQGTDVYNNISNLNVF